MHIEARAECAVVCLCVHGLACFRLVGQGIRAEGRYLLLIIVLQHLKATATCIIQGLGAAVANRMMLRNANA